MDLGRATSEVGEVLPRLVDRTQAQAEFIGAILRRVGCAVRSRQATSGSKGSAEDSPTGSPMDSPMDLRDDSVSGPSRGSAQPSEPGESAYVASPVGTAANGSDRSAASPDSSPEGGGPGSAGPGSGEIASRAPEAGDLAIPSYQSLAAAQVVPRLGSLSEAELLDVRAFESENRHRRTILNRVDQLLTDRQ